MKIFLHNLHSESHFGITLVNYITGAKSFKKYKYLLDYFLKKQIPIGVYLDKGSSSLPSYISKLVPAKIEFLIWCLINGFDSTKFEIITNINRLSADDILFSFAYRNLDGHNKDIWLLRDISTLKVFHLTHFIMSTKTIAEISNSINVDLFVAENNLQKNSEYFRTLFPKYNGDFYTLPFVYQERFVSQTTFLSRKNKCFATGSLIEINKMAHSKEVFESFLDFYKSDVVHPLRKEILLSREKIDERIDSYIQSFWDKERKKTEETRNPLLKIYRMLYNGFILNKRSYFNFNIVDKYNDYRMFVAPEEINDMPGIGFVEGMACGCAYFGIDNAMYRDLGLMPGVHYVTYDGTLDDLLEKIRFYQQKEDNLEKIAGRGYEFVVGNLNGEIVAESFWKILRTFRNSHTD